jgi:hypothetical protein
MGDFVSRYWRMGQCWRCFWLCHMVTPPTEEISTGTSFTQTAYDCNQNQERSIQPREKRLLAEIYRNVGEASTENRLVNASSSREATGTMETWVAISPVYGAWANSGVVYDCVIWSPETSTVPSGQNFTQTANDCKQNQTRTQQNREQETTTLAIRSSGEPINNARTLSDQEGSRPAVGTAALAGTFSRFRIYIFAANSTTYAQMTEVELLDAANEDLFDKYTVGTAESTFYTASYRADKLIDNIKTGNSKWTSSGGNAANSWVSFAFPFAVTPKKITISNYYSTSESNRQPRDFIVQGSNDGLSWQSIGSYTNQTNWLALETRTYTLQ